MIDLHTHTDFSDGKNTAEEMVLSAISLGLDTLGISDHSHDTGCDVGVPPGRREEYRGEIQRLREKYAGRIRILCGIERDYYFDDDIVYDYCIGSVHSIKTEDGDYVFVDWTAEMLSEGVRKHFGGDWMAMAEAYYSLEADVVRKTECDIIGHFDLLTKFNEGASFFDVNDPAYVRAWKKAADELLETGKLFEINMGAISRGYRTAPYPSREIREYIRARGGKFILSSDSHQKETIAYQFDRWRNEADVTDVPEEIIQRVYRNRK